MIAIVDATVRARAARSLGSTTTAFFAIVLFCFPAGAGEREDEAARAFDRGAQLFAAGDYERAAARFMRAFELLPHGDAAYNAALSWERAGKRVLAAETFTEAVGRDLRPEARDDAEARLSRLRRTLAILLVTAPNGSSVRVGDRTRDAPAEFFVEPGEHTIYVIDPRDREHRRQVRAFGGREVVIDFQPPSAEPAEPPRRKPRPALRHRADASTAWPAVGWAAVGTGVAMSGVAVYVGLQSKDARDEFNSSDRTSVELRDRAVRLQTWTRVTWTAAALVGGAGIVILLAQEGDSPEVAAAVTPGGASVRGRF